MPMPIDPKLSELGEFLKTCRDNLTPTDVGLAAGRGSRRVPGLRREEVAQLASISTDYYTRVEQGRMSASAQVLTILSEVLQLDDDQRLYLFRLAGKTPTTSTGPAPQRVKPQLQRLLDDLSTIPAIVMGRRMDILAWNALAAEMMIGFGEIPPEERNYVRLLFVDKRMRLLYEDWQTVARTAVAQFRMEAAKTPDDPRIMKLVGELSVGDAQFRSWWAEHGVATLSSEQKTLIHPVVGRLTVDWDTLVEADDSEQSVVVWTGKPGSSTHKSLMVLAGLAKAKTSNAQ